MVMKAETSSLSVHAAYVDFSMERTAKSSNLSLVILPRSHVFNHLNPLNDLSQEQMVTGVVNATCTIFLSVGNIIWSSNWYIFIMVMGSFSFFELILCNFWLHIAPVPVLVGYKILQSLRIQESAGIRVACMNSSINNIILSREPATPFWYHSI